jgi:glycosyltransferase involved in cell wall biosynthesis
MVPSQSNPYLDLLADSIRAQGIDVRLGEGPRRFPVLPLVFAWLRGGRPQVLHLHWTHRYIGAQLRVRSWGRRRTALELRLLRRLGVRVVWTVHNVHSHEGRKKGSGERAAHAAIARASDVIVCHCEGAKTLTAEGYRLEPEVQARIRVVPHGNYEGVYPDTMDRATAREALGLEPDARVFLFLGQIRRYKGVMELLDAFRQLPRPDARLVVTGKLHYPGLEEPLREHAGDDPRIKLLPVLVPDDRIQVFLRAADALVLPYRDVLTSGSAILGMTFGVPVVAPRIGCLPETLETCGILYDADQPDGLRGALEAALEADLGALGERARAAAEALPWGPIGARMAALYRGQDTPDA